LSSHRGRAYAEFNQQQVLTAFNVAQTTLAMLRGAEAAHASGDAASARRLLDAYKAAWMDQRGTLAVRVTKLETALRTQPPAA
jgi:uncharacterized protein HemY